MIVLLMGLFLIYSIYVIVTKENGIFKMSPDGERHDRNSNLQLLSQNVHNRRSRRLAPKFIQDRNLTSQLFSIDESIEEVATYIPGENIENECENCLNFSKSYPVPFPELGKDIVDPNEESLETSINNENISQHVKIVDFAKSWKENWLFRKKNIQECSAVAMFVPNSNTKYRAMIGDKDADETSDLSEYSTHSDEESEKELILEIKNVFSECKNDNKLSSSDIDTSDINFAIATPTTLEERISDRKSEVSKIYKENCTKTSFTKNDNNCPTNECYINNTNNSMPYKLRSKNDEISIITQSINKSEAENCNDEIEDDALTPQNHCNNLSKCLASNANSVLDTPISKMEKETGTANQDAGDFRLTTKEETSENEINLFAPPKPGSTADREHKKWENAAPIENNPYSKENIEKRLMQRRYTTKFSNISGLNEHCSINNSDISRDKKMDRVKSSDRSIPQNLSNQRSNSNIINMDIKLNNDQNKSSNYSFNSMHPIEKSISSETNRVNKVSGSELKNNKNDVHITLSNKKPIHTEVSNEITNNSPLNEDKRCRLTHEDSKISPLNSQELTKNFLNDKSAEQIIIDKLDVTLVDYLQNNLSRSQSINELNNKKFNNMDCKSNLTMGKQFGSFDSLRKRDVTGNSLFPKEKRNTYTKKDASSTPVSKITSSISFPNITSEKIFQFTQPTFQKFQDNQGGIITKKKFKKILDHGNNEIIKKKDADNQNYHNNLTDNLNNELSEEFCLNNENNQENSINNKISMPSVKKLVQAFNERQKRTVSNVEEKQEINESNTSQLKTQQFQVNQSLRQLHSLTARSLSKEFREGLRQISNKSTLYDVNRKRKLSDSEIKNIEEDSEYNSNDLNAFKHGKLKSNIEFWENIQYQK